MVADLMPGLFSALFFVYFGNYHAGSLQKGGQRFKHQIIFRRRMFWCLRRASRECGFGRSCFSRHWVWTVLNAMTVAELVCSVCYNYSTWLKDLSACGGERVSDSSRIVYKIYEPRKLATCQVYFDQVQ